MDKQIPRETPSHKLNEFGFIDYKKPLGKQQDMRTATYLGNIHMTDTMMGNKLHAKIKESRPYIEDPVLVKHRTTDYRANFVWQFNNSDEVTNPALDRKVVYMKPFYDCNLKFLKRPMVPASSVSHSDYLWRPEPPMLPPERPHISTAVATTKTVVDRNKPGFSKYLDPAATTTSLDYCYRSPHDVIGGISAKDNITFWNWSDIEYRNKKVFRDKDLQLCDKLPSNDCTKRREFSSKVKSVPNAGLTTEVRENYIEPYKRAIRYDDSHIKNELTFVTQDPLTDKTEYNILGSGDCTHKYV